MKIDPYKHQERYILWKESVKNGIPELSEENSKIVLAYVFDMEHGLNISGKNKKGSRSYTRLNSLKQRMIFMCKRFEELYGTKYITKITERDLHIFFGGMRNGTIKTIFSSNSFALEYFNLSLLKKKSPEKPRVSLGKRPFRF